MIKDMLKHVFRTSEWLLREEGESEEDAAREPEDISTPFEVRPSLSSSSKMRRTPNTPTRLTTSFMSSLTQEDIEGGQRLHSGRSLKASLESDGIDWHTSHSSLGCRFTP
jgi:hypothetical protein